MFLLCLCRQRLFQEHAKYDDILQAEMVDHYNNLTLKSVFTLKFFLNESNFDGPPPYHVMKIDNDAYLNLPQLVRVLKDKKLDKTPMYLVGHRLVVVPLAAAKRTCCCEAHSLLRSALSVEKCTRCCEAHSLLRNALAAAKRTRCCEAHSLLRSALAAAKRTRCYEAHSLL
jgi:hypothetical protein